MVKKLQIDTKKLRHLYLKKKLSSYRIAKMHNCDSGVIIRRLKELGIVIRHPKDKIKISKDILRKLYQKGHLSTAKIAEILDVWPSTVYYRLREYDIKTRKKNLVRLSKKDLIELYYRKELSLSKIAARTNHNAVSIWERMKKLGIKCKDASTANTKFLKREFNDNKELKAYMIGFRAGDLHARKRGSLIRVNCSTTKQAQVDLIREVFGSYGHFNAGRCGKLFYVECGLDKSFSFLIKKPKRIPNWILSRNKYFLSFLAGYTDAEGNIGIYDEKARYRIGSYDKGILCSIRNKLRFMKIDTKMRLETKRGMHGNRKHNGDFYRVSVNRKKDLFYLLNLLEPLLRHRKRYNDLINARNNILKRSGNKKNKG